MPSEQSKNIIDEMLLAITANINYLRSEGNDTLRVKNGQLITNLGDIFIYKFELDFFQDIETDSEIEIKFRSNSTSGKVIAIDEKSIQIQTEKYLGTSIAEARIIITSYYLLELLHKKLEEVNNGEGSLTNLTEKTFGISPSITDRSDSLSFEDKTELDKYKQEAMRLIKGSEVSFIWGPPGTGKTQLIASVIKNFIKQGMSTLLISHTNIATDGALERSVEGLLETTEYKEGKILRVGKIHKEGLKKYELVMPEKVLEKQQLPLVKEIEKLNSVVSSLTQEKENVERLGALTEKLDQTESLIMDGGSELKDLKKNFEENSQNYSNLQSSLNIHEKKVNNFQSKNSFNKWLSGTNLQQLSREKADLLNNIQIQKERIEGIKIFIKKHEEKINKLTLAKNDISNEINKLKLEGNNLNNDLNQYNNKIKKLKEQIDALLEQLDKLSSSIINDALVVATTLTKSYSDKLVLGRKYDCIILDEASMAPLPAVWYATGLASKKTVIVGDFFQLPPIATYRVLKDKTKTEQEYQKEEMLVEKWLKKDIFWSVGIFEDIKHKRTPKWLEQLKLQYRMHPEIAELINYIMYSKYGEQYQLESAENTFEKGVKLLAQSPLSDAHVGIYDTSLIGTLASRTDSGSYFNLYQALLAVELAKQAVENGYTEIGIISPFRAQSNLIQKIIKDEQLGENIEADTVHRFQGGERQMIIFDLTTPNPTKLTDDEGDGGDDEKLVNVAFSRAKEKCIIIADIEKLLKKHSLSSSLRKFVNYCQVKKYPIVSSEDILNKYSFTEESEEWMRKINHAAIEDELNTFRAYDQTDFYQNFLKDLISAEREVIIESPFLTSKRVATFLPIFDLLIKKDVNIFIITRPPKEHKDNMKIEAETEFQVFEDMGITILPMYGHIHEKIGIIDRKILWAGSLNILSQSDSREIMWRFLGDSVSDQIITFLKIKKNIGEIGENKLKKCEICNSAGAWYWTDKSRYGGSWTFCLMGMHKPGKSPPTAAEKQAKKAELLKWKKIKKTYTADGKPICPQHEIPMMKRKGHWGFLWGCSKWPRCRITEKYIAKDDNQQEIKY